MVRFARCGACTRVMPVCLHFVSIPPLHFVLVYYDDCNLMYAPVSIWASGNVYSCGCRNV